MNLLLNNIWFYVIVGIIILIPGCYFIYIAIKNKIKYDNLIDAIKKNEGRFEYLHKKYIDLSGNTYFDIIPLYKNRLKFKRYTSLIRYKLLIENNINKIQKKIKDIEIFYDVKADMEQLLKDVNEYSIHTICLYCNIEINCELTSLIQNIRKDLKNIEQDSTLISTIYSSNVLIYQRIQKKINLINKIVGEVNEWRIYRKNFYQNYIDDFKQNKNKDLNEHLLHLKIIIESINVSSENIMNNLSNGLYYKAVSEYENYKDNKHNIIQLFEKINIEQNKKSQ